MPATAEEFEYLGCPLAHGPRLRHPQSKERVRKAFEIVRPSHDNSEKLLGHFKGEQRRESNLAIVALGPILAGLFPESHFEPEAPSEKGLQRIVSGRFDAPFSNA